jgi:hypothetical protein
LVVEKKNPVPFLLQIIKKPREGSGIQLLLFGGEGDKIATVVAIWEPWGVIKQIAITVLRL